MQLNDWLALASVALQTVMCVMQVVELWLPR